MPDEVLRYTLLYIMDAVLFDPFVPRDGCLNFIDESDEVLIADFSRSGHTVSDIPSVRVKFTNSMYRVYAIGCESNCQPVCCTATVCGDLHVRCELAEHLMKILSECCHSVLSSRYELTEHFMKILTECSYCFFSSHYELTKHFMKILTECSYSFFSSHYELTEHLMKIVTECSHSVLDTLRVRPLL